MKTKNRRQTRVEVAPAPRRFPWAWAAAAAAAICAVFWAYGPVLRGVFVFDDLNLPFADPNYSPSLGAWLIGARKLLMASYWLNAQISRDDPYSYHVLGLVIHLFSAALLFAIVRQLLEWARSSAASRNLLAGFAAAVFLLHPAQTEAVAYVAGRSESLSTMFFFAAFAVFLYRRQAAIRWVESAAVLLLFLAALLSKEQTIVLPALLLLTDYWWNPGFSFEGIRRNWKVYAPLALGALAGLAILWKIIIAAQTAGFQLKDFTWYQYFFTQCRALFVYPAIFLFPVHLNADWSFPISYSLFEHGAIFGLAALVALAAVAWIYRRRFPLATYGFFAYLVLMSPTSSVYPIQDPLAERRLYFSMLGLLLIVVDLLGRVRIERQKLAYACAAVALLAAIATHARAAVWADPVALWEDTAGKSPDKFRARFQLGYAYYIGQRYDRAVPEFEKAGSLQARGPSERYNLLADWALALDAMGRWQEALAKLREAAAIDSTAHIYSQIGMIYGQHSEWPQALQALDQAQKIDPGFAIVYVYRGKVFEATGDVAGAIQQFQRALELLPANDPVGEQVRQELLRLRSALPGRGK
jgi:protein O-mannosyl-transferase